MPDLPVPSGQNYFLLEKTIDSSGTITALLNTENKFLDKNIGVRIITPAGAATTGTASATMSVSTTDGSSAGVNVHGILSTATNPTVEPNSGYYVAITANPSGASEITTAGWFNTGVLSTVNGSAVTNYFILTEATGSMSGSNTVTPSADLDSSSSDITFSTTNNGLAVVATGGGTASASASANISTAGYVPTGNGFITGTLNASSNTTTATKYITGVKVPSGATFTATAKANNAGTIKVAAYNSSSDSTTPTAQTVVTNGVWSTHNEEPSNTSQGPFYGKTNIAAVSYVDYNAANIKYGATIKVKGGNTEIKSVTGTFTSSSNVSSGQTAATASEILNGYSAWVNGQEVQGNIQTISVVQNEWSKNSSKVVTTNTASWSSGIVASGSIPAVTFGNAAAAGKNDDTYIDLSDGLISADGNDIVPEIPSGGYLYINKGYIDDVKISLAKLIPDASAVNSLSGSYILTGHSAYDNAGNLIVGTISKKAAATYTPTTTDQTIAAGQYLEGIQTIEGDANLVASKIKYGVTIFGVQGTFTTTPSGKTALTAAALRSGYSGFINGTQVDGTMPDITVITGLSNTGLSTYFDSGTSSSNSISLTPNYTNSTAGYLEQHTTTQNGTTTYYTIKTATFTGNGGNVALITDSNSINSVVSIENSIPSSGTNKVYIKVSGSGQVKTSSAGWWDDDTDTGATGSATKYIHLPLYTGTYSYVSSL